MKLYMNTHIAIRQYNVHTRIQFDANFEPDQLSADNKSGVLKIYIYGYIRTIELIKHTVTTQWQNKLNHLL